MSNFDIKLIRKNLGLNQKDFADSLNVSVSAVQKWEQNLRQPTEAIINLIKTKHCDYSDSTNEKQHTVNEKEENYNVNCQNCDDLRFLISQKDDIITEQRETLGFYKNMVIHYQKIVNQKELDNYRQEKEN